MGRALTLSLMKSWVQSTPKEGSDLQRSSQEFGVSHLPIQWNLSTERKQAVCSSPTPTTRRQIHQFLGVAGFCQTWKPNFSLLAKPLYEAIKWGKREPLIWEPEQQSFLCYQGGNSQFPCSGTPRCEKAFLSLCTWQKPHGNWSPDPISGLMTWAGGLSLQAIGFRGKRDGLFACELSQPQPC
jgi:hypothetical protein